MPPKKRTTRTTRQNTTVDTRELEKLIRDSVRSEIAAQQTRIRATSNYTQRLLQIDNRVTDFIQNAITETTRAHRFSVYSFIMSYLGAFLILLTGIILIPSTSDKNQSIVIPIILMASGIIWMIGLQSRNLVKNNRVLVNNLAKLNIIFASFTRQIHQVDTVFEELIVNSDDMKGEKAEQLLNNLQDVMAEAMHAVNINIGELDE